MCRVLLGDNQSVMLVTTLRNGGGLSKTKVSFTITRSCTLMAKLVNTIIGHLSSILKKDLVKHIVLLKHVVAPK